ncbi:MAG: MFS transporter [Pseudonocardiaceae bacterium]|nr:MFS transporter [Pseudonocardiaceae bacterium]
MGRGASWRAPGDPEPTGVDTPAFRRLWWAWTVSLFGDGVRGMALPLYVAAETRSALAASAVTAAEVLPWLLFALPAGALVDRMQPRTVMAVAHAARALLTAGLAAAIVLEGANVAVICAFAFVLTVGETFAYPASQAMMVELAGRDQLDRANSQFYTVHTIGLNLAGPLAAGALVALGAPLAFALDSLTFVVAAVLVVMLPAVTGQLPAATARPRLRTDVVEGITVIWRTVGLRVLVLMVITGTIAVSALNTLTPLYAFEALGMATQFVPALLVVGALGTLLGTRIVPAAARRWGDGAVMVASMAVLGLGAITFGSYPLVAVALLGNALAGVGVGGWNVLAAARRQRLTPPGAMGRVSGAYRMLAWGLMPVGAALAGPLAVATSLGSVFVIVGCVVLAVLVFAARWLLVTGAALPPPRAAEPVQHRHAQAQQPVQAPE